MSVDGEGTVQRRTNGGAAASSELNPKYAHKATASISEANQIMQVVAFIPGDVGEKKIEHINGMKKRREREITAESSERAA